jgi:hypothetical protein
MQQVRVWKITSPHADTINIALAAQVAGKAACAPADLCKFTSPDPTRWPVDFYKPQDELNGVLHPALMSVGSFILVPDVDPDLIVAYAVLNFGASYTDQPALSQSLIKKVTSKLGAGVTFFKAALPLTLWRAFETMPIRRSGEAATGRSPPALLVSAIRDQRGLRPGVPPKRRTV